MDNRIEHLLKDLRERTKELNCLYNIEEMLKDTNVSLDKMFGEIIQIIPSGWQFPEVCQVRIEFEGKVFQTSNYKETSIIQSADIIIQGLVVGRLFVSYTEAMPTMTDSYFLKEEEKLISAIADRLGHTILHKQMKNIFNEWEEIKEKLTKGQKGKWRVIVDTLRLSDKSLFIYIARRMLQYLCWHGIREADSLMQEFGTIKKLQRENGDFDENRPIQKQTLDHLIDLSDEIFNIASVNMDEDQVLSCIQKWLQENKSRFLVKAIENPGSSLSELINVITKFHLMDPEDIAISPSIDKGLRVALSRRFLSDDLGFIHVAKNYIGITDYYNLSMRMIFPEESRGKLGGKSAGIILASQIIKSSDQYTKLFKDIRVPNTWYITSDGLMSFLHYNNLEEVIEQKFKNFDEITSEYPNIIQIFKNSYFPPEIIKGLSNALDNIGKSPIIVRSSSLLEDRIGATFSGKYKSLFLANQGSKEERLEALLDAVAEVYASTFGPDPIIYRSERGLLDYHEEMGIMIQEVVGTHIGDYYFPLFSGVAFSKNEFRWSPRIDREDGLIRAVPGLGTRAVDRLSDDYCILIAPGKPELRVNVTPDEILHYSTKEMDVINLEKNTFETISISKLIKSYGSKIPHIHNILSIYQEDYIQMPTSKFNIRFEEDILAVTFEGLIKRTSLIKQIRALMKILQEILGRPVDIEFAYDGIHLYLLQCRAQSYSKNLLSASIPTDIAKEKILFTANRYVSDGHVPDILYIVYVDPLAYNSITNLTEFYDVGRAIGKLNAILPKRQFILIGPGRWGSRGDIKLGVNVTYSDINNTAVLIEVARKKGNYVPELSFGTHFFQDLVESSIRYLPLYPDDSEVVFNESFLLNSKNKLAELLPKYASLSQTIRVIDVPQCSDNNILKVVMNADIGEAMAFLTNHEE